MARKIRNGTIGGEKNTNVGKVDCGLRTPSTGKDDKNQWMMPLSQHIFWY